MEKEFYHKVDSHDPRVLKERQERATETKKDIAYKQYSIWDQVFGEEETENFEELKEILVLNKEWQEELRQQGEVDEESTELKAPVKTIEDRLLAAEKKLREQWKKIMTKRDQAEWFFSVLLKKKKLIAELKKIPALQKFFHLERKRALPLKERLAQGFALDETIIENLPTELLVECTRYYSQSFRKKQEDFAWGLPATLAYIKSRSYRSSVYFPISEKEWERVVGHEVVFTLSDPLNGRLAEATGMKLLLRKQPGEYWVCMKILPAMPTQENSLLLLPRLSMIQN